MHTPLVGNQTFSTLTAHILTQAPNFQPTAADLGYTANVIGHPDISTPAFAALLTKTVNAALAATNKSSKPFSYCYLHGFNNSHPGTNCLKMKADTTTFTHAHLNDTNPTDMANGSKATPGASRFQKS